MDDHVESSGLNWEDYWVILRRRRWWLLLPFFAAWGVAYAVSWFLPASYRSETVILVEQQGVPESYVVPNVATDLQTRLQSMTQQILSRTRLERIIEDFHLYVEEKGRLGPDELVERMRDDIRIELVQAPGRRDELTAFKIYYSAPNPQVAQQVTSELTSLFIEDNLRARQQQSENTTAFLENQLKEARKQLEEQEQRLREFKTRYIGQLPEQVQSNVQILIGLQGRVQALSSALGQAEQQKLYLESLLAQYRSLQAELQRGKTGSPQLPSILNQELDELKTQLADLNARYKENHPDVRHLKEQIAETEKLKEKIGTELAAARQAAEEEGSEERATSSADLQALTPMMQIESQLKSNQLEIENRRREIKELETQIQQYQARLNLTPLREQELADLTRDYTQSRANYESLLAKKMQSELASNLEKRQQGEQFRILDPPSLPKKPYWPDRLKLSLLGLLAGMLLGLGSVAGTELIDDRVYSEKELRAFVPAVVLAGIPRLPTPWEQRQQRWRQLLELIAGALMVTVITAGFFAIYYWG